ncbi:uncharacterized protein LOC143240007 [Tachypleus tridentatus]|uniref:uncharacterized protein LOC143240007 n=1 Tax=Tachypleus tridentatus TaxID=6853 RepID=UPI003FD3DB3C
MLISVKVDFQRTRMYEVIQHSLGGGETADHYCTRKGTKVVTLSHEQSNLTFILKSATLPKFSSWQDPTERKLMFQQRSVLKAAKLNSNYPSCGTYTHTQFPKVLCSSK